MSKRLSRVAIEEWATLVETGVGDFGGHPRWPRGRGDDQRLPRTNAEGVSCRCGAQPSAKRVPRRSASHGALGAVTAPPETAAQRRPAGRVLRESLG